MSGIIGPAASAGAAATPFNRALFSADGSWTVPAGVKRVLATLIGAGGGIEAARLTDGSSQTNAHGVGGYHPACGWFSIGAGTTKAFRTSFDLTTWRTTSYSHGSHKDIGAWRQATCARGDEIFSPILPSDNRSPFPRINARSGGYSLGPALTGSDYYYPPQQGNPYAADPVTGLLYAVSDGSGSVYVLDESNTISKASLPAGVASPSSVFARDGKLLVFRHNGGNTANFGNTVLFGSGSSFSKATVTGVTGGVTFEVIGVCFSDDWSSIYLAIFISESPSVIDILKSTDYGASWTKIGRPNTNNPASGGLYTVRASLRGIECTSDGSHVVVATYSATGAYVYQVFTSAGVANGQFSGTQPYFFWRNGGVIYAFGSNKVHVFDPVSGSERQVIGSVASPNYDSNTTANIGFSIDEYGNLFPRGSSGTLSFEVAVPLLSPADGSAVIGGFGTLAVAGGGHTGTRLGGSSGVQGLSLDIFTVNGTENTMLIPGRPGAGGSSGPAGVPGICFQHATGASSSPGAGAFLSQAGGAGGAESTYRFPLDVTPGESLSILVGKGTPGANDGLVMLEW